jgi:uncharacterized protein
MNSSRRNFLAAGLALPVAASASRVSTPGAPPAAAALNLASQDGGLRYRTLGKTGLKVTTVAFGCMITSDASVIERGADMGINYFDTARGYQGGQNERVVGAALKGKRKNVVLSTKTHAKDTQGALKELETSLRELGTDWVDIWYIHAKSRASDLSDELMEAIQTAKKAGKIRFAGVSTHAGIEEVLRTAAAHPLMDVILVSYNFASEPGVAAGIEAAAQAGKGIVGMKVMAGGMRRLKPGDRMHTALTREGGMLAALKWVVQNPNVHTNIPSMTDMEQLEENFKAMVSPFGDADRKILAQHLRHIAPLYCRMCGGCDGVCPQGVPVADVLRCLMYAEDYGQFPLGREQFLSLPRPAMDVRCADCGPCVVQCRNGVRVAERLVRAQELFA